MNIERARLEASARLYAVAAGQTARRPSRESRLVWAILREWRELGAVISECPSCHNRGPQEDGICATCGRGAC